MKVFFKLKIAEYPEISSVTVHKVKRSCLDLIFKLADFILQAFVQTPAETEDLSPISTL